MMGPTEPVVSGVIAYNGDSQRGWNDPPTLSFTGISTSKKGPKIDLRKRVSHQEALTGRKITSPSYPNSSVNPFSQTSQVTAGLSNLVFGQPQPSFQPDQSPVMSPCHSRHSSGSYTPPLVSEHQNCSSPSQAPSQFPIQPYPSTNPNNFSIPTTSLNPLMPVTTSNVVSPMVPTTMGTILQPIPLVPSTITPPPQVSSPVIISPPSTLGKPLFSPKSLNMTPVSSALDTIHVRSKPDILLDPSQQMQDCNGLTTKPSQNILPHLPNKEATTPLIFNPSPNNSPNFINGNIENNSPILNRSGSIPRLYTPPPVSGSGRNSPVPPPPTMNRSPISTPTGVHSGQNTPRSNSPEVTPRSNEASRHNSEDFDSVEAMDATVEALEETILKCSDILKNRGIEDVKKKLGVMKQQWQDDKLSLPVQKSMKSLAKALLENDTETSHKLHVQLMVDYVGEVKQWMVAIKRLISAVGGLHT